MSQAEVGRPFTRAYISLVETGRTLPSLPALLHIAAQLDVDPCLLLPSRRTGQVGYTRAYGTDSTIRRPTSRQGRAGPRGPDPERPPGGRHDPVPARG